MAIIFPANTLDAAEVPDFSAYGGIFKYQERGYEQTIYHYSVNGDFEDIFEDIKDYMWDLENLHNFSLSEQYTSNASHSGKFLSFNAFFTYGGAKNISLIKVHDNKQNHYCHLSIKFTGRGNISIHVADGLEYEGDTGTNSSVNGGDNPCPQCGGSGRCPDCGGSGRVTKWGGDRDYHNLTCTRCGGSGTCSWCHGSGKA